MHGSFLERQDGEDFKKSLPCHFQDGSTTDMLTYRSWNRAYKQSVSEISEGKRVHFFTTYNDETKASIVERYSRTLKTKMWKYFTHRDTLTYVDVLFEMVASYNHTVHRSIGIPPAEVTCLNQTTVSKRLYGRKEPTKSGKFSPGDRVRLSMVIR
jgi:translation initiation factor IF-1